MSLKIVNISTGLSSVENAVNTAVKHAIEIGFNKLDCNLIAYAVSEIATNIIKYANSGKMIVSIPQNRRGIEIEIDDNGPGIKDIQEAMTDGFSSKPTSLGVGLGAAKRAMDSFNIHSLNGKGTKVLMSKWLPISENEIEHGVVSLSDSMYLVNGDGYVVKELGGETILIGIIDGLGEGKKAYNTTQLIKNIINQEYQSSLVDIINKCDQQIRSEFPQSGAAIAIIKIFPDHLTYTSIGDTFVNIYSNKKISLSSQMGIVGNFRLPVVKVLSKNYSGETTIIMCTDGIKNYFLAEELPLNAHAHYIAEYIMNNYRRDYGDATVYVVKIKR